MLIFSNPNPPLLDTQEAAYLIGKEAMQESHYVRLLALEIDFLL
jgi:hypothetical protein